MTCGALKKRPKTKIPTFLPATKLLISDSYCHYLKGPLQSNAELKASVKEHWEGETCGTRYAASESRARYFEEIEEARYRLEPYIREFANFAESKGKKILEIGVGAGTDFSNWVKYADKACGVDLTESAIRLTDERLKLAGIDPSRYELSTSDAENLPFADGSFDLVYSWGVLHHTPNTEKAFREVFRILKPGAKVKAMIYHVNSWTGLLLWGRYCLFRGRPFESKKSAIFQHLESPGTKAYTLPETRMFLEKIGYTDISLSTRLGPGDLLKINPSKKYQSAFFRLAWKFYPRWLIETFGRHFGLYLLIEAKNP